MHYGYLLHFHNFIKQKENMFFHASLLIYLVKDIRDILRYEYDPYLSPFADLEVPVELHHHNQCNYLPLIA